jgi:hypothetical protein
MSKKAVFGKYYTYVELVVEIDAFCFSSWKGGFTVNLRAKTR